MAQTRPCFFRIGQSGGSTSSTDLIPKATALPAKLVERHRLGPSNRPVKHQLQTDWLIRPLTTTGPSAAGFRPRRARLFGFFWAAPSPGNDAAAAAREPATPAIKLRRDRRIAVLLTFLVLQLRRSPWRTINALRSLGRPCSRLLPRICRSKRPCSDDCGHSSETSADNRRSRRVLSGPVFRIEIVMHDQVFFEHLAPDEMFLDDPFQYRRVALPVPSPRGRQPPRAPPGRSAGSWLSSGTLRRPRKAQVRPDAVSKKPTPRAIVPSRNSSAWSGRSKERCVVSSAQCATDRQSSAARHGSAGWRYRGPRRRVPRWQGLFRRSMWGLDVNEVCWNVTVKTGPREGDGKSSENSTFDRFDSQKRVPSQMRRVSVPGNFA